MSTNRRLAAILAADVVGYSRLMGEDEAGTAKAVREHREAAQPIIASHGGRIVKTMGDGVLLEFPSVVAAVECAIAIQKLMAERNAGAPEDKRIVYRIGVHIGDVLVEDEDILGDGVNIAARLEGIAEPGGVCLSEDAYRQVRDKIKTDFSDMGEKPLRNVARSVRVYQISRNAWNAAEIISETSRPTLGLPDKPSIAVLPFQNMSGDPEQEYFVDGMVEDIITGLSRIRWMFVIARNSSFIYKNKTVDVRQVGRELGVRYVLEGGVQRAGSRLRITTQLVEAENRAHLWADKFDGALEDVFQLQDEITDQVVGVVEPSLQRSEIARSRRKRPDSLGAYDLVLRALPHMQTRMPAGARIAIPMLERAIALDPDYAAAHAYLAWCHEWCFTRGGFNESDKIAALAHARRAIASDMDDAAALAVAGWVTIVLTKDYDAALNAIQRALSLNASCAMAHYFAALVNSFANRPTAVSFHAKRALRLSPFDSSAFEAHLALGMAAVSEANYDEAAARFARASQINSGHSLLHFFHAIALALAGRANESTDSVQRGLELEPGFRVRIFSEFGMAKPIADRFAEGARLLGLPE